MYKRQEIAWRQGWISDEQIVEIGNALSKNAYGRYLLDLVESD